MSDATVRIPQGLAGGVTAYVREVRSELADLPAEDVDDLTGGMEADLSELAAEFDGDLIGRLGSPPVYAAELRSAAGLPQRSSGRVRRRPLTKTLNHARAWFAMQLEQRPWLRSVTAFLVTLRPAWWLVRGYLAAWALWSMLDGMRGIRPHGFFQLFLAFVAVIVSVQLGRGWLRERSITGPLLGLANAAAVVVALTASTSGVASGETNGDGVAYATPMGVSFDGGEVGNIYPYDSDGQRLSGIRLFAQDGRPLNGPSDADSNGSPVTIDAFGNPAAVVRDSGGAPLLNVYPQASAGSDPWQVAVPPDPSYPAADPSLWSPPVSIVPLAPTATATPTATPTGAPTLTPEATAPAAPTATAAPKEKTTGGPAAKAPTSKLLVPKAATPTSSSQPSRSVARSGR